MSDLYTAAEENLYLSEHVVSPPLPKELPGQNCLIVELAAGQLVLLGDFNLFRIDDADRELIDKILDAVEEHKSNKNALAKPLREAPPPEPPPPSAPSLDEELAKLVDLTLDEYRKWTDDGRPPLTQWRTANEESKPEEPTPEAT